MAARRAPIIKRKPKTTRVTKSEQFLVNSKYLGDEPTFVSKELGQIEYARCLSWYNYMCNNNDAKEYLITYLKNTGKVAEAKKIRSIPDSQLPLTAAWSARMIGRGAHLPKDAYTYTDNKISEALEKAVVEHDESETSSPKNVISIQDRMRERLSEILGEVEGVIDDYLETPGTFSFYNWLQSNEIPAVYISKIVEKLAPRLEEIKDAYDFKSGDLIEAYAYCKKKDFERMISFFTMMIEDAERYAGNVKKVRKVRKPRVVSTDKKIKNLKWQKEDATYKLASIAPEKIVGAQELWTFNTKYKTLTVFRAMDRGGLQVKGTSITNYNPENSFTKGTGRRTDEHLKRIIDGGKLVLRKIMDELKTDKALAYRINENTILLRAMT